MLTMAHRTSFTFLSVILLLAAVSCPGLQAQTQKKTPKAVFIIVDGIPADVIGKLNPPGLATIAKEGGFTQAYVGGTTGGYNQTPTISAPGYIDLLAGVWGNKHNVWDNDIAAPNYHYWNIFRIAETVNPALKTAVFSTWLDNRTKLIGEGLPAAGAIKLDYAFDGFENDTIKYPHDKPRNFIRNIDDAVTAEAAGYIATQAPDLSWVYLEYTDDMGHGFGDSPQFYDAIKGADARIKKIWDATQLREKNFNEDWLIVITTDHGRDATTGKNHGGQSARERTTWIATDSKNLNAHFKQQPAIVDILPSICNHLNLTIPTEVQKELDGVPFIGPVDIADLHAEKKGDQIVLTWKSLSKDKTALEISVTESNHFKEGGSDAYTQVGTASIGQQSFSFTPKTQSGFYKILVKSAHQYTNTWVVEP